MRHAIALSVSLLVFDAQAEAVLYGVEVPERVSQKVDSEEKALRDDTALHLSRQERFEKYQRALREQAKREAEEEYRHQRFPQFSPGLVTEERERMYEYEKARKEPMFSVSSEIKNINVDPLNPQPVTIVASVGEPTRLIFMDHAGNPWPVLKTDSGKKNRIGSHIVKEVENNNQVAIELEDNFVSGNVLLNLQDYGAPLVVRIEASAERSTAYANIRIERTGPLTEVEYSHVGAQVLDEGAQCRDVYRLLENASVPDAERHYLAGVPGQVWVTDNHTYIRSTYRLVFPFGSCQTSDGNGNYGARIDGTDVYTATFVMEDGKYKTVRINDIAGAYQ